MKNTYSPKQFGSLIGRTTKTLQKWDRDGILKAHRSITNRRYYTHDQYLEVIGKKSTAKKLITYCRVSSAGQKSDLISQRKAIEALSDRVAAMNYARRFGDQEIGLYMPYSQVKTILLDRFHRRLETGQPVTVPGRTLEAVRDIYPQMSFEIGKISQPEETTSKTGRSIRERNKINTF
jgi:predicted site-specific integrase-resolvase